MDMKHVSIAETWMRIVSFQHTSIYRGEAARNSSKSPGLCIVVGEGVYSQFSDSDRGFGIFQLTTSNEGWGRGVFADFNLWPGV